MDDLPSSVSPETAEPSAVTKLESDAEMIAWARKRGYVSFLFFFLIAASVGAAWFLTR